MRRGKEFSALEAEKSALVKEGTVSSKSSEHSYERTDRGAGNVMKFWGLPSTSPAAALSEISSALRCLRSQCDSSVRVSRFRATSSSAMRI